MKKILFGILLGIIFAQTSDYLSCELVSLEQKKCYPLWSQNKQEEYQTCMNNRNILNILANITGFNFIYTTRQLIFGY